MKIFKFGGASVRDAEAVHNLSQIIQKHRSEPLTIVLSAMGKSTNMLEKILSMKFLAEDFSSPLAEFKNYHFNVCQKLFPTRPHKVFGKLEALYEELDRNLLADELNFDKAYDRIVCYGELLSTTIVHAYLVNSGIECELLDAREVIITDSTYRAGKVRWDLTGNAIRSRISCTTNGCYLTQGFIAADESKNPVTLGREGSDFTAAILAFCLEAESVTIWKDVPGVMNADPAWWKQAVKYEVLSYGEAAEMTYYGASVIHPKTIRPLAVKKIPLLVKSFKDPDSSGTSILEVQHLTLEPAIIVKKNQCLISFNLRDFSFINESKISIIFHLFEEFNIRVNMMQCSAISFSVSVDSPDTKIKNLINSLSAEFDIFYNDQLELITIKNYRQELISSLTANKEILLEQRSRKNYQALVGPMD